MFRWRTLFTIMLGNCFLYYGYALGVDDKVASKTPEQVAKDALDAIKTDRIDAFAKMMHPDALMNFKSGMVAVAEGAAKLGQEKSILKLFDGVNSIEELRELEGAEVFVRFMNGYGRLRPEMRKSLSESEAEIVGHVAEGQDLRHVVCRMTMTVDGVKVTKMEVITVKRADTGWAMLLRGDIETVSAVLLKRFGQQSKSR